MLDGRARHRRGPSSGRSSSSSSGSADLNDFAKSEILARPFRRRRGEIRRDERKEIGDGPFATALIISGVTAFGSRCRNGPSSRVLRSTPRAPILLAARGLSAFERDVGDCLYNFEMLLPLSLDEQRSELWIPVALVIDDGSRRRPFRTRRRYCRIPRPLQRTRRDGRISKTSGIARRVRRRGTFSASSFVPLVFSILQRPIDLGRPVKKQRNRKIRRATDRTATTPGYEAKTIIAVPARSVVEQ